jgi:recombination associated protein RdgC
LNEIRLQRLAGKHWQLPNLTRNPPVFKNMIVYRIAPGWQAELTALEEALA